MLAAVAWPLQEILNPIITDALQLKDVLAASNGASPSLLNGGLFQLEVLPALLLFVYGCSQLERSDLDVRTQTELKWNEYANGSGYFGRTPGDFRFDPLNFYKPLSFKDKVAVQERELVNGRIASMATALQALEGGTSTAHRSLPTPPRLPTSLIAHSPVRAPTPVVASARCRVLRRQRVCHTDAGRQCHPTVLRADHLLALVPRIHGCVIRILRLAPGERVNNGPCNKGGCTPSDCDGVLSSCSWSQRAWSRLQSPETGPTTLALGSGDEIGLAVVHYSSMIATRPEAAVSHVSLPTKNQAGIKAGGPN